jgi:regulator of cell morphogenesis and NO signaling
MTLDIFRLKATALLCAESINKSTMTIETTTEPGITIGNMVANNYKTADVFKKYGIDFCCKGNRLLADVCLEKNLDLATVEHEVAEKMNSTVPIDEDMYQSLELDDLAQHIEQTHHKYVRDNIQVILSYLHKINSVHGARHPELTEIYQLFDGCTQELTHHMVKEETILFPAIKKLVETARSKNQTMKPFFFGTLSNPIGMMQDEHVAEGERFFKIAELSDNYTTPADGCTTYDVAYRKLKEFQDDLFLHIHLENNILFPKALRMEKISMHE